jgi:hypothetical protein
LRVVQPSFVVSSLSDGISRKIFQIPELEEVIGNRASRRAKGRGQSDGWVPSKVGDTERDEQQTQWGSATRRTL